MRRCNLSKTGFALLLCGALVAAPTGCSRSSGSSSSGGGSNTRTATPGGGGGNPTPTPILDQVIIDGAGTDLSDVIKTYPGGVQIIVSPGTYAPIELTGDDIFGPLTLLADETGSFTGRPGIITILAQDKDAAINLDGLNNVVIDGVQTIGGRRAGILIANGNQIVLQHNRVRSAAGDGIRIERSSAVLVFDNLMYDNGGIGLSARGLNTMEAVNNTVYGNRGGGIAFLRLAFDGGSAGSPFGFLLNNIIDQNTGFGIRVDEDSQFGFEGNFNLNNDGYIGVNPGPRDLQANPLFIFPTGGEFRMQDTVGPGGSPAVNRGDPNTEAFFVSSLVQRTTRLDGIRDLPPVDLGYHYPNGINSPTPPPTFTPRNTVGAPASTSTRTSTPTPTPTPTPSATLASQAAGQSGASAGGSGNSALIVLPTATATATPVADEGLLD